MIPGFEELVKLVKELVEAVNRLARAVEGLNVEIEPKQ